jgi:hypothetical protein
MEIEVPEGTEVQLQLGVFTAWNESLPATWMPPLPGLAASLNTEFYEVDMVFNINSRGDASNPRILRAAPDTNRLRRDARDGVKEIQFRPRLTENRPRRVKDVVLRYRYPSPP